MAFVKNSKNSRLHILFQSANINLSKKCPYLSSLMTKLMENIGGGMAAPSKSAVGPIWLGRQVEEKTAQKTCAAMSFSLFSLNIK